MDPETLITRVPLLSGFAKDYFKCKPLGGYTNQNFRLEGASECFILRLPRDDTNRWINRSTELNNLDLAIANGLAPAYRYFSTTGVMLSDCLTDSTGLSIQHFEDDRLTDRLLDSLRHLHQLQPGFKGEVYLPELLERYYAMMDEERRQQQAERYREMKDLLKNGMANDSDPVSSHNDLVLQNLLLQGDRLWIIDWEYSSRASPYWDLATLCNELRLEEDRARDWLQRYDRERLLNHQTLGVYRTLLAFLSDCWFQAIHPS